MREPKFVPGERVMVRSEYAPEFDTDCTEVINARYGYLEIRGRMSAEGWKYQTAHQPNLALWYMEDSLRKLPPETPATFDASIWVPNKECVK